MQDKAKEKSKRITAHNKMIRQLRANGELKPLGTMTYHQAMQEYKGYKKQIRQITENGSVLPNVYARWADDDYCNLCY